MSKAVLISIQPKWCELIASGKKTVEVRKTRPKLETPFKVYIYCTKDEPMYYSGEKFVCSNGEFGNGKIIGEFTCYNITYLGNVSTDSWERLQGNTHKYLKNLVLHGACLKEHDLLEYGGKYAWHISDLLIYDEPKALGEFFYACDKAKGTDCSVCVDRRENKCKAITRPPRSWCYVEVDNG